MRTVLLALALLAGLAAEAAAETLARPHAQVTGRTVRLGDLFDIAGPRADRVLGPSPAPGQRYIVPTAQLAAIARSHGLVFSGGGPTVVERMGRQLGREEIEEALRPALAAASDRDGAIELAAFAAPSIPIAPPPRVIAEDAQVDPATGRFGATLVVLAEGEAPLRFRVTGRVQPRSVAVPVAARRLAPGTTIGPSDVRLVALPQDRVPDDAILDEAGLRGRIVQRGVAAGAPIARADLGSRAVVSRNSPVTMTVTLPGLVITAQGRALEDGAPGDVIQVLNLSSRAIVEATVTGPGRVSVKPGSAPLSRPQQTPRPERRAEPSR